MGLFLLLLAITNKARFPIHSCFVGYGQVVAQSCSDLLVHQSLFDAGILRQLVGVEDFQVFLERLPLQVRLGGVLDDQMVLGLAWEIALEEFRELPDAGVGGIIQVLRPFL